MEIVIEKENKLVSVFITGRIDSFTCAEMYNAVINDISDDADLLFDFRDVEYIYRL